jgi:hypothetical protein
MGLLFTSFVGATGTHGPVITGTQGHGVGTGFAMPAGFVGALHMANGMMFTIGAKSIIVPTGLFSNITGLGFGVGTKAEGAAPKMQVNWAPATIGRGIAPS